MADVVSHPRILVSGASGFVGGHLTRSLMAAGADVIALGRNEEKLAALGCEWYAHDISEAIDPATLPDIDAIVHCAALSAPFGKRADFVRTNVDGTRGMIALAHAKDVARFVHISTPSVYFAFKDQLNVHEYAPLPPPVNHYASTKAMAEKIVLEGLPDRSIILRPRGIYGPNDAALLPRLLNAAGKRALPKLRDGQAAIDLTYIDDVIEAIFAALGADESAAGHVFNISGGEVLSVKEIVDAACEKAGITARWRPMPLGLAMIAARAAEAWSSLRPNAPEPIVTRYGLGLFAYRQSLDIEKAKEILGWTPRVRFADGLDATFSSFS